MLWRNPTYLWLLLGVAFVAITLAVTLRRRAEALRTFAEAVLVPRLAQGVDTRRRVWRAALRIVALAALVVALAGPKWGFHWEEVQREGIDLIIAMDTSRSMLATDVKPNRLERAKLAVLDLVPRLKGDRVGLVAYAGTAFLEAPLTLDYAAFERSLRALRVGIIPRDGTSLSRAIETSLQAFEARQGKYEALVLITDGEDHEGDAAAAAQKAADRGVKIYTVGIGTEEGELLPLGDGQAGFVKDRKGRVVKSRLNEEVLQEIALAASGAYVRGIGPRLGLDEVFDEHIAKMERREVDSSLERRYEERFQIPLAIGLLLLLIEQMVRRRKPVSRWGRMRGWLTSRRRGRRVAAETRALTTVLLLLFPSMVGWLDIGSDPIREGNQLYDGGEYGAAVEKYGEGLVESPASPILQYNFGVALYKDGRFEEAGGTLQKVAAEGGEEWGARANYNLGNTLYRVAAAVEAEDPQKTLTGYAQALVAYRRAMAEDASDLDSKFNHELVQHKLEELQKRLEEEQQEQEQQEQEQEQQEQQEEGEEGEDEQEQQEEQQEQEQEEQQGQEGEEQEEQQEQQEEQEGKEQQGEEQQQEGEQEAQEEPPEEKASQEEGAGGGAAGEETQQQAEEQAAQAVLDTARSEELRPEDMQRPVTVRGLGSPSQEW
jgi:Ca-activated chloride channel family protein